MSFLRGTDDIDNLADITRYPFIYALQISVMEVSRHSTHDPYVTSALRCGKEEGTALYGTVQDTEMRSSRFHSSCGST